MSAYYYDDPIEDASARRRRTPTVLASILILLAGGLFLKTTLAANISINTGVAVEFGQGSAATAACSGSTVLTVTPTASFTNSSGGSGSFYLTSITVSGIPTSCNGDDFNISAYNTTGNALPLFNTSSTVAPIWDNGGSFQGGHGFAGSTVSTAAGSFTITFTSPVALASNVAKLTLQSAGHVAGNCATENLCSVGDVGPGGGTVFYVGASFTETGTACGSNCHYLEAAPTGWANNKPVSLNGSCGGNAGSATTDPNICPLSGALINTPATFGAGFTNNQTLSASTDATSGIYLCTHYAGTDSSAGQWFLPSGNEMGALWNSSLNSTLDTNWYWSSSISGFSGIEYGFPNSGPTYAGYSNPYNGGYANNPHSIRAIRAF